MAVPKKRTSKSKKNSRDRITYEVLVCCLWINYL